MFKSSIYLVLFYFLFSCAAPNKLITRTFSTIDEMIFVIKEDFKKNLSDLRDTIYYFPPITSKVPGDTTIIMFGSCKPLISLETNIYSVNIKSRVLGDTILALFPSKDPPIYLTHHTEYYIDKKKLKILWIETHM